MENPVVDIPEAAACKVKAKSEQYDVPVDPMDLLQCDSCQ